MPRHPFYNSIAWKRLRQAKLWKTPLCESCGKPASDVDHKISIQSGGARTDSDNLQSLCHECHSRKTYYVDVLGMKGVPNKEIDPKTGVPKDPNHWWNDGA